MRARVLAPVALLALGACGGQGAGSERKAEPPPAAAPAAAPLDESVDAKVAGTDFHATGSVRCALRADQPMADCEAGVVRNNDGSAIVTVFWPGGGARAIVFGPNQTVVGADVNAADGSANAKLESARTGDLTRITIGGERYEIVDALPYGG